MIIGLACPVFSMYKSQHLGDVDVNVVETGCIVSVREEYTLIPVIHSVNFSCLVDFHYF